MNAFERYYFTAAALYMSFVVGVGFGRGEKMSLWFDLFLVILLWARAESAGK